MSDEFSIDIDKALENAKTTDLNGFVKDEYPDGLESVRKAVENAENLCGLDRLVMKDLLDGEWTQYFTQNSGGRQTTKVVIEYEVRKKSK